MNYFPKTHQVERGRNPSHLHSMWLGIWFAFAAVRTVIWGAYIQAPAIMLLAAIIGVFVAIYRALLATVNVSVIIGRNFIYGMLGGLVSNDKSILEWEAAQRGDTK